jgi:hypothetical protein
MQWDLKQRAQFRNRVFHGVGAGMSNKEIDSQTKGIYEMWFRNRSEVLYTKIVCFKFGLFAASLAQLRSVFSWKFADMYLDAAVVHYWGEKRCTIYHSDCLFIDLKNRKSSKFSLSWKDHMMHLLLIRRVAKRALLENKCIIVVSEVIRKCTIHLVGGFGELEIWKFWNRSKLIIFLRWKDFTSLHRFRLWQSKNITVFGGLLVHLSWWFSGSLIREIGILQFVLHKSPSSYKLRLIAFVSIIPGFGELPFCICSILLLNALSDPIARMIAETLKH